MVFSNSAQREKTIAALTSVAAAITLTALKIVVALLTGSLGLLAEASHSGLDLVAALMTFFAVRVADRPADANHNYGHDKIENISAFIEALLLLLTAAWVIFEAIQRLLFDNGHVSTSWWAFLVMSISIIVDFTRSKVLMRVAKKLGSQALEADALHFSTDIWSSAVVIVGLFIVSLSKYWHLPAWTQQADAIAALGVSAIVIWVSLKLARETIDALVDKAPGTLVSTLQQRLSALEEVTEVRRVRVRRSGNKFFTDIIIAAPRTLTFEQIHTLSNLVEKEAITTIRNYAHQGDIDAVVHVEPVASPKETVIEQIHYLAESQHVHVHNIHVREVDGELEADFDLEVQEEMDLGTAHMLATQLEQAILQGNKRLHLVTTHLEVLNNTIEQREDVTEQHKDIAHQICSIADRIAGFGSAHEVHLYYPCRAGIDSRKGNVQTIPEFDLVLHTTFDSHSQLSQVHVGAEEIKRALRQAYPNLNNVTIHTEPPEYEI